MAVHGVAAPDGHKAVCLDQFIAPAFNVSSIRSESTNNGHSRKAMDKFGYVKFIHSIHIDAGS
jgi:hypothetical protein